MKIDSIIGFHAGAVIAVTDDDKVVRWFPAPEPTGTSGRGWELGVSPLLMTQMVV